MSDRDIIRQEADSSGDGLEALLSELKQRKGMSREELVERLRALGSTGTKALILLATNAEMLDLDDESPRAWVPVIAVRLLGELADVEAVPPLVGLLDRFDDDLLGDAVTEGLGMIGPEAVAPLREVAFDREKSQWTRSRAVDALAEIAKHHPEARAEVVAILRARLDPAESREPDDEMLTGVAIADLVDLKAVEAAPDIRRAFDEDRVDTSIVELGDALKKLGLPVEPRPPKPTTGLRLRLVCSACHRERPHVVDQVYYDPEVVERRERGENEPYSEFVIPRSITCPKCGAVDQYELSTLSKAMLLADLVVSVRTAQAGRRGKGRRVRTNRSPLELPGNRLKVLRFRLEDGRPMHPFTARDMYRAQVDAEPNRADLRLRYGKVLRFLGHYDEALDQCRKAADLDPTDLETLLTLGMLARDAGRPDEAREWLERTARQAARPGPRSGERADYLRHAVEEIADLDRPAQPGGPAVEMALTGAGPRVEVPKVGRNDPCPCGSGKKYKKCHGR